MRDSRVVSPLTTAHEEMLHHGDAVTTFDLTTANIRGTLYIIGATSTTIQKNSRNNGSNSTNNIETRVITIEQQ